MHPRAIFKEKLIWVGCAVCGRQPRAHGSFKGVVIDEESWTGADFFELTNIGGFIGTEAFASLLAAREFRGVALEPPAGFVPSHGRRRPTVKPPGGATSSS